MPCGHQTQQNLVYDGSGMRLSKRAAAADASLSQHSSNCFQRPPRVLHAFHAATCTHPVLQACCCPCVLMMRAGSRWLKPRPVVLLVHRAASCCTAAWQTQLQLLGMLQHCYPAWQAAQW